VSALLLVRLIAKEVLLHHHRLHKGNLPARVDVTHDRARILKSKHLHLSCNIDRLIVFLVHAQESALQCWVATLQLRLDESTSVF